MASNPNKTKELHLDREYREIDALLRHKPDIFSLEPALAVRDGDLQDIFYRYKPNVVHFAGHGDTVSRNNSHEERGAALSNNDQEVNTATVASGIILENLSGMPRLIPPEVLTSVFALFAEQIRLVVLNSCWGAGQADALVEGAGIPIAIGMRRPIGDDAAIQFAKGFYLALSYGESVGKAFQSGKAQMQLIGTGYDNVPDIKPRSGIDPDKFFL